MSKEIVLQEACFRVGLRLTYGAAEIDRQFGEGYAKANPVLLSAYLNASVLDFSTYALLSAGSEWASEIAVAISENPSEGEKHGMRQALEGIGRAVQSLANAVYPANGFPTSDAVGGRVESLTDATMGTTGGLVQIAEAVNLLAAKVNDVASVLADQEAS